MDPQGRKRKKAYQLGKGKKKWFFKKEKNLSRLKCYNCGKKGHFARDYKEPKKVNNLSPVVSAINVASSVLLTESYPLWTVDSRATDHVGQKCLRGISTNPQRKKMDICGKQFQGRRKRHWHMQVSDAK